MGVDQLVTGGDVDDPDVDSVTTSGITDSGDGQAWETLRELGYETGDVVPFQTFTPNQARNSSVSSTTYTNDVNVLHARVNLESITNAAGEVWTRVQGNPAPGSGETLDVAVIEGSGGTTMAEVLEATGSIFDSGWQKSTLNLTGSPPVGFIDYSQRTNPGTNSSASRDMHIQLGLKL